MKIPTLTGIGSMGAVTTQNISLRVGPCNSGNLLAILAGKRASSNFTFPTNWTKAQEIAQSGVTSGMASALAYKWGALADSGSTVVISTSGAGNLLHAVSIAFGSVDSAASPLGGLATEVSSSNIARAASLTPIGLALGVCGIVGFDNVAPNAGGFTPQSWAIANSHTTTTGSDGHLTTFVRSFYLANSGAQFNPNSAAGTAPRHAYTFWLRGAGEALAVTEDDGAVLTDDYQRAAMTFFKLAASTLFALDTGTVRRAWSVLVNEGLVLLDAFIEDVTEGGAGDGTVYPVTRDEALAVAETALRMLRRARVSDEALAATEATVRALRRVRLTGEALALADTALGRSAYVRLLNEAAVAGDAATGRTVRGRAVLDTFALVDSFASTLVGGAQIYTRAPIDAATVIDELRSTWRAVRMLGEHLTPDDETRYRRTLGRAVADSFAPSDQALRSALRQRILTEALAAADTTQQRAARRRLRDESFTLADALVLHLNRTRRTDEALALVDALIKQGLSSVSLTDGVTLQDGALSRAVRPRQVSDLAVTLDELRLSRTHGRLAADLLTVDDKRHFLLYLSRLDAVTVTDSTALTRSLVRALTEALTLGDSLTALAGGIRIRVANEQIEIADGLLRVRIARRRVGDDLTLADPVIATSAGLRVRDMAEALTVSDQRLAGAARGRVVQDLVTALYDQAAKGATRWRALGDALDPRDLTLTVLARTILRADSLTLDDGALDARVSVRALWDILELTDSYTKAIADALANVLDVRILIDALRSPVTLGSFNAVTLGVGLAAALGAHDPALLGATPGPILGGYN